MLCYSRFGDIIVIPDTGWFVTSKAKQYSFIIVRSGEHGYDNNAKTMRVSINKIYQLYDIMILLIHRHLWLLGDLLSSSFDNIQLYNLECGMLCTCNKTFLTI